MTLQCIVCNSTAVIHKYAAKTMAVLVSSISSAIQGAAIYTPKSSYGGNTKLSQPPKKPV